MNTLRPGDNDLVPLDYSDLLEKILAVLQNQQTKNPFSISSNSNQLVIDIDEIAFQVAGEPIENPLRAYGSNARSATVNLSPGSKGSFNSQVKQIRDCLRQHIESILAQRKPKITLEQYVTSLITDLSTFHSQSNISKIGFNYNFDKYEGLNKQRLSLRQNNSGNSLLKFNKLTIKVEKSRQFEEDLKISLNNFINFQFAANSEDDREEIKDILNDLVEDKEKKSDF